MPENFRTLSTLLAQVKNALVETLPDQYWIIGEILELHENRNGHCYLELIEKHPKNDSLLARAKGTIWASRYSMLRPYFETSTGTSLKSGIKLLCRVSVEFHPQYGFSLNITDIDPAYTLGDLARKKQEVISRLRKEGVFDMNREIPFPEVPQRIAVISSETAAGYGDFMETIETNSHGFRFSTTLFPAVMQGEDAPGSITAALDKIHESEAAFDCVAIIRGGGSKADLESFNHYDLAYFITQFPLPVITGIGHERDESVADMVASYGLKTPTAVAEFLVDQLLSFEFRLTALYDRMASSVKGRVQGHLSLLDRYRGDLVHFTRGMLLKHSEQLLQTDQLLRRELDMQFTRRKDHLALLVKRTELVNPVNILKRGYSMTLVDGKIISSARNILPGNILNTRLHQGSIVSKVEYTTETDDKRED
ncbi:MAG: exodeoxyribonuclease VII large subunit [Bacteroidales bacterium]|nr:exodeoxyribonuclease VII large subunit [Bacteroidales bacterium]